MFDARNHDQLLTEVIPPVQGESDGSFNTSEENMQFVDRLIKNAVPGFYLFSGGRQLVDEKGPIVFLYNMLYSTLERIAFDEKSGKAVINLNNSSDLRKGDSEETPLQPRKDMSLHFSNDVGLIMGCQDRNSIPLPVEATNRFISRYPCKFDNTGVVYLHCDEVKHSITNSRESQILRPLNYSTPQARIGGTLYREFSNPIYSELVPHTVTSLTFRVTTEDGELARYVKTTQGVELTLRIRSKLEST